MITRKRTVALYGLAAMLMAPWVGDWLLDRLGVKSSSYLGAPSIRLVRR